jgi:hypothetical protein
MARACQRGQPSGHRGPRACSWTWRPAQPTSVNQRTAKSAARRESQALQRPVGPSTQLLMGSGGPSGLASRLRGQRGTRTERERIRGRARRWEAEQAREGLVLGGRSRKMKERAFRREDGHTGDNDHKAQGAVSLGIVQAVLPGIRSSEALRPPLRPDPTEWKPAGGTG